MGGGVEVGADGADGRDGADGDTAQLCLPPVALVREDGEGVSTQEVFENLTPLEHDVALSVEKEGKAKVVKRGKLTSYFPIINKE